MHRPFLGLAFAIWWKLVLLLNAVAFVQAFAGYVLPWGQLSFWLATTLTAMPPWLAEFLWSMPSKVPSSLVREAFNSLILFALLYALLRFHVGRRYGGATLAWRMPGDVARSDVS